jgi:hypothetical protein
MEEFPPNSLFKVGFELFQNSNYSSSIDEFSNILDLRAAQSVTIEEISVILLLLKKYFQAGKWPSNEWRKLLNCRIKGIQILSFNKYNNDSALEYDVLSNHFRFLIDCQYWDEAVTCCGYLVRQCRNSEILLPKLAYLLELLENILILNGSCRLLHVNAVIRVLQKMIIKFTKDSEDNLNETTKNYLNSIIGQEIITQNGVFGSALSKVQFVTVAERPAALNTIFNDVHHIGDYCIASECYELAMNVFSSGIKLLKDNQIVKCFGKEEAEKFRNAFLDSFNFKRLFSIK